MRPPARGPEGKSQAPGGEMNKSEARAAYHKAEAAYRKARVAYDEAEAAYHKAGVAYDEAEAAYHKAGVAYDKAALKEARGQGPGPGRNGDD